MITTRSSRVDIEEIGQALKHDMRAAHRLDVAGHVGDDGGVAGETGPVLAELDPHLGIGLEPLCVDAVVDDREPVAQIGRERVALVARRGHGEVGRIEGAELHGVLQRAGARSPPRW